MNGVPACADPRLAGCAELGLAGCCLGALLDEGPEIVTSCLAEEELVAECHRLVSIVSEGS